MKKRVKQALSTWEAHSKHAEDVSYYCGAFLHEGVCRIKWDDISGKPGPRRSLTNISSFRLEENEALFKSSWILGDLNPRFFATAT